MRKKILTTIFLGFLAYTVYGQKASVRATIEPSDIQIGEQAIINLEVIAPKDVNIVFPIFNDTITTGIEVLGVLKPDTTVNEVITYNQKYVITSFDSTLYHIDRIPVFADNDTIYSNQLGLKVATPQLADSTLTYLAAIKNHQVSEIDYAKFGLHDIKEIQYAKWNLLDMLYDFILISYRYVVGFIGLIIILGLIIFFIYRKRKKGYYFKPKITLPPHVIALDKLDKLKDSKIWQQGQIKEYYTELTDIIREYIYGRYSINATEMTSKEILAAIGRISEDKSINDNLSQVLKIADLVKFATLIPLADENDLSLTNTYLFVNKTKIEIISVDDTDNSHSDESTKIDRAINAQPSKAEETNYKKENNEDKD